MSPKKIDNKRNKGLKKIRSLIPVNLKIDKIRINPLEVIQETKGKIGNFYVNLKKERINNECK